MFQILSALILDFTFFYVSLYWVLYTRNFRLFATLIIFYGVRAIHLSIFKLEFAPNYHWTDPGVPSLVVKYGYCSDFFYSVKKIKLFLGPCWFSYYKFVRNEKDRKEMDVPGLFYLRFLLGIYSYILWNSLHNWCTFLIPINRCQLVLFSPIIFIIWYVIGRLRLTITWKELASFVVVPLKRNQ